VVPSAAPPPSAKSTASPAAASARTTSAAVGNAHAAAPAAARHAACSRELNQSRGAGPVCTRKSENASSSACVVLRAAVSGGTRTGEGKGGAHNSRTQNAAMRKLRGASQRWCAGVHRTVGFGNTVPELSRRGAGHQTEKPTFAVEDDVPLPTLQDRRRARVREQQRRREQVAVLFRSHHEL
jgi:hypothetical protein